MFLNLRGMRPHVVLLLLMVATQLHGKELSGHVQKDPVIQLLGEARQLKDMENNLKDQKEKLEGEIEGINKEITSLSTEILSSSAAMEKANEKVKQYRSEAEMLKDLSAVVDTASGDANRKKEELQLAEDTHSDRQKELDAAIKTYDGDISTWEQFEQKYPKLEDELQRMDDLIVETQRIVVRREEKEECEKELANAITKHGQLKEIEGLHKSTILAGVAVKTATTEWEMTKEALDRAIQKKERTAEKLGTDHQALYLVKRVAKKHAEKINLAESKKLELEAKKKEAEMEVRRLGGWIAALKMALTTPGATSSSETITSSTANIYPEIISTATDNTKGPTTKKRENFVGSLGFWILIGLAGSAILLGVVGIAVYFSCRKKKNAETMRSDRASDPSIGLENSLRSDLPMSQADSSNVSQAPSQASTASRSEIA